jgi:PKD repeat protein
MTVYSEVPQYLTVVHNPIIYAGVTNFDVTANEDALIALTVNGEIIATANGTGSPVSITIPGQQPPDQVLITITKQNYYRYSSLIEVIPPAGPYIVQNVVLLNDTAGNGNGIMETSEEILVSIGVQNVGIESANNVTVTISSSDEFISITDNNEFYGSIAAGEISTITDGFALTVADNIPDMHQVSFELNATDGTDTWTTYFVVQGHGPSLECGTMIINDAAGNNNGRLDPGETADIIIQTSNNGSFIAAASMATINTSCGFLTLNNSTFDLGVLGSGLTAEATFNVTAAANTPIGTGAMIYFEVTSGGYLAQQSFTASIGLIVEDWESGDMSQFDWVTGGSSNWALNTTNPYEGAYCIKSGALNHSQSNYLSLQYELFDADSISFWYKVSSESGYDFLKFFVDNIEKTSWSGEVGWERAAYAVTAGTHTFKWTYSKDQSVVGGSDCAWVDFIVLPASVFEAYFTANENNVCEGSVVNFYDQSSVTAISWDWTFEGGTPATSTNQNPVVGYLNPGVFDVSLTVSDGVETVTTTIENYITVSALPGIVPSPTGLTMVCADWGNTSYTTAGLSGITSYDWVLEPANAGSVSGTGLTATVQWTSGFLGDASLKVAGENICGAGTYSNPINITRYLPEVTLEPFDWICLGWPSFELTGGYPEGGEYTGAGVDNGWFDPAAAGAGTHTIIYTYGDPNGCENFTTGTILVDPCTGIEDAAGNAGVQLFPNPNNGSFTLVLNLAKDNTVDLKIFNALNELVFEENNISVVKNMKHKVELNGLSKGIYYLHVSGNSTDQVIKIIVQK